MESAILGFIIGVFAIFVTSISGGGNNLVLFPLLLLISPSSYISTFTVAKAAAAIHSITSSRIHLKNNTFNKTLISILICTSLIGTFIGTKILEYTPDTTIFKLLLSITLITSSAYMLIGSPKTKSKELKLNSFKIIVTSIFSILINILNGIFGGTGIFLTAYLILFLKMDFKQALANTAISYVTVNIIQASYLLLTQNTNLTFLIATIFGSSIGSYLGAHFIYKKSNETIKYLSPIMMSIIGIIMFVNNI